MSDDLINQLRAECASKHPTLGSVVLSVPDARRLLAMAEDLNNERAVRSRRELSVTRAIAHANKYRHPGTNVGDHKVLSEMVEILEGTNRPTGTDA